MFDAYNHKDLQHLLQLLTQLESSGTTDIRFVREKLYKHLYKPQNTRKIKQNFKTPVAEKCPSCGKGTLFGPYKMEQITIYRCSLKCGYSEAKQ